MKLHINLVSTLAISYNKCPWYSKAIEHHPIIIIILKISGFYLHVLRFNCYRSIMCANTLSSLSHSAKPLTC